MTLSLETKRAKNGCSRDGVGGQAGNDDDIIVTSLTLEDILSSLLTKTTLYLEGRLNMEVESRNMEVESRNMEVESRNMEVESRNMEWMVHTYEPEIERACHWPMH